MKCKTSLIVAVVVWISSLALQPALAQGTAFTYQGRLNNGATPANGNYDLTFALFSASSGGTTVAGPETNSSVVVSNGLFTAMLDFGPTVFNGTTYWLEIGVRTNGGGSFVTLSPRQQLTPAPNAIFAENATALANGVAIGSGMGNMIAPNGPGFVMNSFIGGGMANNIQPGSLDSAVVGGQNNMIQPNAAFSFIGGGLNNQAASEWSVIGGGNGNIINIDPTGAPTMGSTIGGGFQNLNNSGFATVAGGFANSASGMYSMIGGGSNNIVNGDSATIGGGDSNLASGIGATVAGGEQNIADEGTNNPVGDVPEGNPVLDTNPAYSYVGGGLHNSAHGLYATVSGGNFNGANGTGATVAGGEQNYAYANFATISGGEQNSASGLEATVGGGTANTASGSDSTVPGGIFNVASGIGSFAAGSGANAINGGSFVWADGEGGGFGSSEFSDRDNQFKIQAKNGVVMDVSGSSHLNPAALYINSSSSTGVGLYVVQTNSTDAAVVINSYASASSPSGGGDIIKGFGWSSPPAFIYPNQLVFEVTVLGDVYGHSFNSTSDRNAKENFSPISPAEILHKVTSLPVSQWNFKGEQKDVQHIGPMAQDFHAAFGLDGAEDKRISLTDEGGVALAAIQGLNQKVEEKNAEIQTLKQQNDSLAGRLNELEAAVKQLAAQK